MCRNPEHKVIETYGEVVHSEMKVAR
jgi:hypothetical protein